MASMPVGSENRAELLAEARALATRVEQQTERAERLRTLADRIDAQTSADQAALDDLAGILGISVQLRIDDFDERLGGQRLERVAVRILRDRLGPDAEIHYRDWFALVEDAGHRVGGKRPLATFLAQLNRSTGVERVGQRSGRYRLRVAA